MAATRESDDNQFLAEFYTKIIRSTELPPLVEKPSANSANEVDREPTKQQRKGPIVRETSEGQEYDFGIYQVLHDLDGQTTALAEGKDWDFKPPRTRIRTRTASYDVVDTQYVVDLDRHKVAKAALQVLRDSTAPITARHTAKQLLRIAVELLKLTDTANVEGVIRLALITGQLYERMRVEQSQQPALDGKLAQLAKSKGGRGRANPELEATRIARYREEKIKDPTATPHELWRRVAEREIKKRKNEHHAKYVQRVNSRRNTLRKRLSKVAEIE